jgi:hypothetical protein
VVYAPAERAEKFSLSRLSPSLLCAMTHSPPPQLPMVSVARYLCFLSLFPPSVSQTELALADDRGGMENKTTAKKCWPSSYIFPLQFPSPSPPCVEKFVMVRKVQVVPTIRPQPWALYYIYTIYNIQYTPPTFFSPLPLPLSYSFFLH